MFLSNLNTRVWALSAVLACVAGCHKSADVGADAGHAEGKPASIATGPAELKTAGTIDFPVIPSIIVPDILGSTPAQVALEDAMQDILDPVAGISVRPANCATDGALINQSGITQVDNQGNVSHVGEEGIFNIGIDGSGTANFPGGIVTVNADGSGTINGVAGSAGDSAIIRVDADGSGSYNGKNGLITLDGKGAGTWNGPSQIGIISNAGDGSGTWNGPQGIIAIHADGSGTWNGPNGLVSNLGDGTGTLNGKPMKMAPIPPVAKAGKFPPLKKFAPPGAPCGFVITLNDAVLFDFDKSEIRPDARKILDTLSFALGKVQAKSVEVRGHTDAKGSDAYNQALSERRAESVVTALRNRGAAQDATSKGYGETQPVAPNELDGHDNPAGRQQNRRVEIFVRT